MKEIYEFDDYRDFLRSHYEERKEKESFYSYRYICMKVGFKSSFLARLFKKQTHLGLDKIPAFADLMKLSEKEKFYFEELVRFGRAKNEDDIEKSRQQLNRLKGISFTTIQSDEEDFFAQCHHMSMRSLLGIGSFTPKEVMKLGTMFIPPLSAPQVEESISLLTRLGMVICDESGHYQVTDRYISTQKKWSAKAIGEYQYKNIDLSKEALLQLSKEERDISTVTFTINKKRLPELREKLQTFREDMFRFSEECIEDDQVMHLNLQLFPTARIKG